MAYESYVQTMDYNPLVRFDRMMGGRKRYEQSEVLGMLEREYKDVDYDPYEYLDEYWIKKLDFFHGWDVACGSRRVSVASMGNYFRFSNLTLQRKRIFGIRQTTFSGSILVTRLPQSIPGKTKIFTDTGAVRLNYDNEHIAFKKDGFTVYSTAPDEDLFHYVDTQYLARLRQMCDTLGVDVCLTIEGNDLVAAFYGMQKLFFVEGADQKTREHEAWEDVHKLLYMRMMTYPFKIWDELGYCD